MSVTVGFTLILTLDCVRPVTQVVRSVRREQQPSALSAILSLIYKLQPRAIVYVTLTTSQTPQWPTVLFAILSAKNAQQEGPINAALAGIMPNSIPLLLSLVPALLNISQIPTYPCVRLVALSVGIAAMEQPPAVLPVLLSLNLPVVVLAPAFVCRDILQSQMYQIVNPVPLHVNYA